MSSLLDRFCPNTHDAPITGAAYDSESGIVATSDATGQVAIQRPHDASPRLVFRPGGPIQGAVALIRGGSMVAVGDEHGTIGLYKTTDGTVVFRDEREGERGRVRAMRGVAVNSTGSLVASIAKDGLLRLWNLTTNERDAWREFSGTTVEFDHRGERLLLIDPDGHPQLFDLTTRKSIYMDRLQTPATHARFSPCGTLVIAGGSGGISLLRVSDGSLTTSFATRGGSGIQTLLVDPSGSHAAAVTKRSIHIFSLPALEPVESRKHGAPSPEGAAIWDQSGIRVGGSDGLMHRGGGGSLGPVTAINGIGPHRLIVHNDAIAVWNEGSRTGLFRVSSQPRLVTINRTGTLTAMVAPNKGLRIYDMKSGSALFRAEPETESASAIHAGGDVVSMQYPAGGTRWWDLSKNQGFSLPWPRAHALSGSGAWLAVITPKGAVRILDTATGQDALAPPTPLSETPIVQVAFMNRHPSMLVLDADGILGHYDLTGSAQTGRPANGSDILSINGEVDRIWGATGGSLAALRMPESESATILWVDVLKQTVVGEVTGLPRTAEVDVENGLIIAPGRAGALLEQEQDGTERRVLRDLPDGEWISFGPSGIQASSEGAASSM